MAEIIDGKCLEMCPKEEISVREKQRRLAIFEILPGTEGHKLPKADKKACVKEYVRSAAGTKVNVSKLRPPHVLLKCMNYLIDNILVKEKHKRSWTEVYHFVSDRIRAIRQDMTIQRVDEEISLEILQKAVRFHIVIMEELKKEGTFEKGPCMEQLYSCLFSLLQLAEKEESYLNEFRLYYVFLNIQSKNSVQNMLMKVASMQTENCTKTVLRTIRESQMFVNYYRIFKLFEELPYISSCCLIFNLGFLRAKALDVIFKGYYSKTSKIPLKILVEWLKFDDERDAENFCTYFGIQIENGCLLISKKLQICEDKIELENSTSWRLLGKKYTKSLKEYINEGECCW